MLPRFRTTASPLGPAFARLLWSDALMLLSLMVGQVVLPWWIAQQGGAADLALYGTAMSAVSFVAMPLLSPLGDRYPKRRLIAWALAVFALAAGAVAGLASLGHYHLGPLIALETLPVMAMAVVMPASASLCAELVAPALLARGLARQQTAQAMGRLIGPALGGAVLAAAGTAAALWLHCGLLVAAARLAIRLPSREIAAPQKATRAVWWSDLRAGVRANWAIPLERGWIAVNALSWIFLFPALTMLVPLKVQSLGLSAVWLGWCEAALSVGMLAGALGVSPWVVRRIGRFHARLGAAALQGLSLAAAGLSTRPLLLVGAFAAVGLSNSALVLVGMTHRMLARPVAFRARMSAGAMMTTQLAASLGPALAGLALLHANVSQVQTAFGLIGALASLGLAAVPGFRGFMALEHHEVDNWYGRHFPEAFEPAGALASVQAD